MGFWRFWRFLGGFGGFWRVLDGFGMVVFMLKDDGILFKILGSNRTMVK